MKVIIEFCRFVLTVLWQQRLIHESECKEWAEKLDKRQTCSNCGCNITSNYQNQSIHSEVDEYFCDENCENKFVNKNL